MIDIFIYSVYKILHFLVIIQYFNKIYQVKNSKNSNLNIFQRSLHMHILYESGLLLLIKNSLYKICINGPSVESPIIKIEICNNTSCK